MGQIDAAGDIVTGALLGRAVEPDAGEAHGHGATCRNCATPLAGAFCHGCGQPAHIHRTLHSILHDLLHGVFHFEGKIWATLPMLLLYPGALTRRYIEGERAKFVSPLALFLFSVFLMFAAFSWSEGGHEAVEKPVPTTASARQAAAQLPDIEKRLADTERRYDEAKRAGHRDRAIGVERTALRAQYRMVKALSEGQRPPSGLETFFNALREGALKNNPDSKIAKKLANPELLIYKIKSSMYKFSWALIPISVPFVWLMLAWKRFQLYDHVIFVIYSISAMTLLTVLLTLLAMTSFTGWMVAWLLFLAPPVHMFLQLRGTYRLRWFSALWRTLFLLGSAFVSISLFLAALVALGLFE